MTTGGTGKQRTDRLNGLAVAADDPANIALAHLQPKNGHLSARYFREHDLVGKLNELTNDELEELLHKVTISRRCEVVDHRLRRSDCGYPERTEGTLLDLVITLDLRKTSTADVKTLARKRWDSAATTNYSAPSAGVVASAAGAVGSAAGSVTFSAAAGAFEAVACGAGAAVDVEDDAAACLLFFLIKLRTVSEGCAPREIQCSTRSRFNPLL